MLDRLRRLFAAPANDNADGLDMSEAVAALLVYAAHADGQFESRERETISRLLSRQFDVSPPQADALIAAAELRVEDSVELYGFTRAAKDVMTHKERLDLMEMMWEVVLADGVIDDFESNLMRRLAGLIYVSDRESGEARQRAAERMTP
ncbi:TerB family tellurite resistance protein [Magnetospira thiophila]